MRKIDERLESIPTYQRIADVVQAEISEGQIRFGERLPSESQLCIRFRENRYVVRKALDLLLQKGMIRGHQGKGYYVCEKPLDIEYTITQSMRFSDMVRRIGKTPSLRVIHREIVPASARVAEALQIPCDDSVYRLVILRFADGVPIAWNTTWLPVDRFPNLLEHCESLVSLYDVLERVYGVQITRMWSTFQSVFPTAEEAHHLQIAANMSLLNIESAMRDGEHRMIEYTSAKYRGDLCRVEIHIS